MICPVEIASDLSALQAARVGDHGRHGVLHAGRSGAGDEGTGSDFAGHGEEDHVVASGRDYWDQRPADAALARALRRVRVPGLVDRRRGKPSPKRVAVPVVEKVLGPYREKYFDLNVRRFHEKLQEEHQVGISYSWVKGLQGREWWPRGASAACICVRGDRCPGCCCTSTVASIAGFKMSAGTTCWSS